MNASIIKNKSLIGVSLGGRALLVGRVQNGKVVKGVKRKINNSETEGNVIKEVVSAIQEVMDDTVTGIGFGAPSLVDVENGIVYNVQKIKAWKQVYIREILEDTFGVPVYVNNDANCFAVGELYFGQGKGVDNLVGLIIGVGVGAGIIFKKHLYSGSNCGSGEYGNMPYRDHDLEHYLSDSYFDHKYGLDFEVLLRRAKKNDKIALAIFEQYGFDLANAIKMIMYSVDPEMIILGGHIAKAFEFFKDAMWEKLNTFVYKRSIEKLRVEVSKQDDIAVLGAAALYFDANNRYIK
ncbi:MAG: ROK family protein [Bacteroidales bacterium]|nr:ROK family protein [Bacteroidales bacterium]